MGWSAVLGVVILKIINNNVKIPALCESDVLGLFDECTAFGWPIRTKFGGVMLGYDLVPSILNFIFWFFISLIILSLTRHFRKNKEVKSK